MAPIPLVEVISFSTEHPVNRVSNIMTNCGKWTIPVKNVSAVRGKEITEIQAEFKVPLCRIEAIDIGNFWSSVIEIEVGRSGESASSRHTFYLSLSTDNVFFSLYVVITNRI